MPKNEIREVVYIDTKVKIDEAMRSLNSIEKKFSQMQDKKLFGGSFTTLARQLNGLQKDASSIKDTLSKGFTGEKDVEKIIQAYSRFEKKVKDFSVGVKGLNVTPKGLEDINPEIQKIVKNLNELKNKIKEVNNQNKVLATGKGGYGSILSKFDESIEQSGVSKKRSGTPEEFKNTIRSYARRFSSATTYEGRQNIIDEAKDIIYKGKDSQGNKFLAPNSKDYEAAKVAADAFFAVLEQKIAPSRALFEQLTSTTEDYDKAIALAVEAVERFQREVSEEAGNVEQDLNNDSAAARELYNSFNKVSEGSQKLQQLGNRIAQLTSATLLFRRAWQAIQQGIRSVIELDEQFNEISIVTGRSMNDMWDSFSAVNSIAQEYGVTTKDVLDVQNLYYHQGKSVAQVNQLTAETLTLAKISGMDYADTTNKMTAALNAFNISANEANRVTDVTAALASNAAADSKEIMNALTKTASISANAGMSLENTEVFLTKMLETTRESAENLGTALKTITARFTELKKNVDIDEDGVVTDFNKVDTALKTAGVALKDTSGQFRNVDDVFMDLSKVWDTLDRNTQRYIATQAAGSRQQSRFIAMIEDYDRTLELTKVAQESAGTGSEQLARAQESLNTAINKIKASWQDFYTTFIRSDVIKGILKGVNSFIQGLNDGHTVLKSMGIILTLITAKYVIQHAIEKKQLNLKAKELEIEAQINATILGQNIQETNRLELIRQQTNALKAQKRIIPKGITEKIKTKMSKDGVPNLGNTQAFKDVLGTGFANSKIGQGLKTKLESGWFGKIGTTGAGVLGEAAKGGAGAGLSALGGIAATVGPILAIAGAVTVIASLPAIINKINNYIDTKKAEESVKALEKATENYRETVSKTNSVTLKYKDYQKLVAKGEALTTEEREELKTITNELAELSPEMVSHYDEEGNAILKEADALDILVEKQKEKLKQDRDALLAQKEASAQYGIFDESSAAGQSWKRATQLAANIDVSTAKGFSGFGLSKKEITGGLETLTEAKGLNRMVFGGITNDDISTKQWQKLRETISSHYETVEKYQKEDDPNKRSEVFREALEATGEYSDAKIDYLVNLNEQLGNSLLETFVNMGDYINTIKVQDAKLEISNLASDLDLDTNSPLVKSIIEGVENYSKNTKVNEVKLELSEGELRNIGNHADTSFEAWLTGAGTIGKSDTQAGYESIGQYIISNIQSAIDNANFNLDAEDLEQQVQSQIYDKLLPNIQGEIEDLAKKNGQSAIEYLIQLIQSESVDKETENRKAFLKKYAEGTTANQRSIFDSILGTYEVGKGAEGQQEIIDKIVDSAKRLGIEQSLINDMSTYYTEELQKQKEEYDKIVNSLTTIASKNGLDFSNILNLGLDTSQLTGFRDTISTLLTDYGTIAAQDFANDFYSALEDVDPSNRGTIAGKIQAYIEEPTVSARQELERLGVSAEKIDKVLVSSGNGGANAFQNIEDAATKLKTTLESLTKITKGFTNALKGVADLEDLETLITKLNFKVSDFKATADGFKLIGDGDLGDVEENITSHFQDYVTSTANAQAEAIEKFRDAGKGNLDKLTQDYISALAISEAAAQSFLNAHAETSADILTNYERTKAIQFAQLQYEQFIRQTRKEAWEAEQENIKKAADKAKEALDRVKDLYELIKGIDPSEPLKDIRDYLDLTINEFQKTRELNLNIKINKQSYVNEIKALNSRLALDRSLQGEAQKSLSRNRGLINKNKYVSINSQGMAMLNPNINGLYNQIRGAKNKETIDLLKQELDNAKDLVKAYNDDKKAVEQYGNEAIEDLEKLKKIRSELYQKQANLEKKIKDILIANDQKELENYKSMIEGKKQALQDYLNAVQNSIDKERQMRDLADKEDDLRRKERKLSILEMDTSGLYAGDVANLQNEISSDRRSLQDIYVDNYIKQQQEDIDNLSQAYERDITAWESYLEWKKEDMSQYRDAVNGIVAGNADSIFDFIKTNSEEFIGLTEGEVKALSDTTLNEIKENKGAIEALNTNEVQNLIDNINKMTESDIPDLQTATEKYYNSANAKVGKYKGSIEQVSNKLQDMVDFHDEKKTELRKIWDELIEKAQAYATIAKQIADGKYPDDNNDFEDLNTNGGSPTVTTKEAKYHHKEADIRGQGTANTAEGVKTTVVTPFATGLSDNDKNKKYSNLTEQQKHQYSKGTSVDLVRGYNSSTHGWMYFDSKTKLWFEDRVFNLTSEQKKKLQSFNSGGYADFTGPAWLDGTPSHPEAVLNAEDTRNFEQLRDLLRNFNIGIQPGQNAINNSYQDSFTVEINVGELGEDYTVDDLVNELGDKIYEISTKGRVIRV